MSAKPADIPSPVDLPLVSVFLGCYNHSRFVEQCLESVRNQTYPNLQVIILDDCSKDDSVAVIERWLKERGLNWHLVRHQKNVGVCATLNEFLALARGKYIAMVAADDLWLPDKTAVHVALLEAQPSRVGVVYSDAYQIDEHGALLPKMFIEAHRSFPSIPEGDIHQAVLERNFIPAMTTLIRRECYDKVGHYDTSLAFEDWDMWIRISHDYEFIYSRQISAKYRILQTSMMRTRRPELDKSCEDILLKYLRRGWLRGTQRKEVLFLLKTRAKEAYQHKARDRHKLLFEACRRQLRPSCLTMLLFSILNIPSAAYTRAASMFRQVATLGRAERSQ